MCGKNYKKNKIVYKIRTKKRGIKITIIKLQLCQVQLYLNITPETVHERLYNVNFPNTVNKVLIFLTVLNFLKLEFFQVFLNFV